ncbi:hypothetical protein [Bacillus sp. F56]|uniref:hypothetical protein n=1 Tax=Bacillus sp. F56 TaxID=1581850 RepID=UPI000853EC6D|nr:hypothetical protein [Bacillus sp. F56]WMM35799.1 hypothetical protein [Bacillus phage vB_BteM-A9Y]
MGTSQEQESTVQINSQEQENTEQISYPSVETLLSTVTREYDTEANRKRDIETRAGVLIALLGALIGFYTSALDFSFFKKANSSIEILCFVIVSVLYIFPAIMQLIAFKHLINVLKTYEYDTLGLGGFDKEHVAQKPKENLQFNLTKQYKKIIVVNRKANDTKVELFKKGIKEIYISIIGIVVVYFMKQILLLIV